MKKIISKRELRLLFLLFSISFMMIYLTNYNKVSKYINNKIYLTNNEASVNDIIVNSGKFKVLELEKVLDIDFPSVDSVNYSDVKYSSSQGFTLTDDYYVISLIGSNELNPESGESSRLNNYTKILFYKRSDNSLINQSIGGNQIIAVNSTTNEETKILTNGYYMRHANDMAFNKNANEILVIDGGKLWHINASNFEINQYPKVGTEHEYNTDQSQKIIYDDNIHYYSAIALSDDGNYILQTTTEKGVATNNMKIYDYKLFNLDNTFKINDNSNFFNMNDEHMAGQGISYNNGYTFKTFFAGRFGKINTNNADNVAYEFPGYSNLMLAINNNGEIKQQFYFPTGKDYGEIEGIEFDENGMPYFLFNKEYDSNGNPVGATIYKVKSSSIGKARVNISVEINDSAMVDNVNILNKTTGDKDSLTLINNKGTYVAELNDLGIYEYSIMVDDTYSSSDFSVTVKYDSLNNDYIANQDNIIVSIEKKGVPVPNTSANIYTRIFIGIIVLGMGLIIVCRKELF